MFSQASKGENDLVPALMDNVWYRTATAPQRNVLLSSVRWQRTQLAPLFAAMMRESQKF